MSYGAQRVRESVRRQARQATDRAAVSDTGSRVGPHETADAEQRDNGRYVDITGSVFLFAAVWESSTWGT